MADGRALAGKVALITGGGSGIGRATAERFAAEGAAVVVADLDPKAAGEVAKSIGGDARAVEVDVSSGRSVASAFDWLGDAVGRLDILINNAGIVINGPAHELLEGDWDRQLDTNLKSVYLVSKAAWPWLCTAGVASIVNVGSLLGLWAKPSEAAYCASKAGVVMLTKCLALDGARVGIRANCVCPGYIDTPITRRYLDAQVDPAAAEDVLRGGTPLNRLGQPADVADAMLFLASAESRWITGAVVPVDGGVTCGIWGESSLSEGLYERYRESVSLVQDEGV